MLRSISSQCRCLKLALLFAAALGAQDLTVNFTNGEYRLQGWSGGPEPPAGGWESVFPIYAGASQRPMLGTYTVEANTLIFRPRFPIESGVAIHGSFPGGGFASGPALQEQATTRVAHVYPSADVLPANMLRMYVYFSAPMSVGDALEHIHLFDESGQAVQDAFLDQELWDPDHKRLTLLLDPGRIKRGVVPAKQMGTAILPGRHYKLMIDRSWHDAQGVPLSESFTKTFTGAPAERRSADPKSWVIGAPAAGTKQPLVVRFSRPMDRALLDRMLRVSRIPGTITVDSDEMVWRFTPGAAWKAGAYSLDTDSDLEDICGNRLDRPFDIDLHSSPPAQPGNTTISIRFTIQ